jgi:phosphoribosylformylglycinamidine cyclo-ligase
VSKYVDLGVDVEKKGIEAFQSSIDNIYKNAFAVITQDPSSSESIECMHTDGAGSKPIQSYLHWKESGSTKWFEGLAQDVVAMNLNDIACVGIFENPIFVDYVAINPLRLPKIDVLKELNSGFMKCLNLLREYGINIRFSGGETADLPDQLRTLDLSGSIYSKGKKSDAITGERIENNDLIIGLESGGKAKFETEKNSGIMCNLITLARHSLMKGKYERLYPEIGDPKGGRYYGRFNYDDYDDDVEMTIGEAILSPTRLYVPIIKATLNKFRSQVKSIIHNTGGGQTKCLRVGDNVHFIKNNLPPPLPIFTLIQKEAQESWRDMYKEGNMGIGLEMIIDPEIVDDIVSLSEGFGVKAQVVGNCKFSKEGNKLTIKSPVGKFQYGK